MRIDRKRLGMFELTAEQVAHIDELRSRKRPVKFSVIAREFGVPRNLLIMRWQLKSGMVIRPPKKQPVYDWTAERIELLKKMWYERRSLVDIGQELGRTSDLVFVMVKKLGLPKRGRRKSEWKSGESMLHMLCLKEKWPTDNSPIEVIPMPSDEDVARITGQAIIRASLHPERYVATPLVKRHVERKKLCHAHDELTGWKCENPRLGSSAYCAECQGWRIKETGLRSNFDLGSM